MEIRLTQPSDARAIAEIVFPVFRYVSDALKRASLLSKDL
jgi:hypothetical protein